MEHTIESTLIYFAIEPGFSVSIRQISNKNKMFTNRGPVQIIVAVWKVYITTLIQIQLTQDARYEGWVKGFYYKSFLMIYERFFLVLL